MYVYFTVHNFVCFFFVFIILPCITKKGEWAFHMMTTILASGSNAAGQLANGTTIDSHTFTPCLFEDYAEGAVRSSASHRVQDIASGANHALILIERRDIAGEILMELWGCGDGSKGQLGPSYLNDTACAGGVSTSTFRRINLPLHEYGLDEYVCRSVASSWQTSYVVLSCPGKSDVVLSMGADDFGALGSGETKQPGFLHLINFSHILPADTVGLVVESIAAGPRHVIVYLECTLMNGTTRRLLAGWGNSRHGQLGNGITSSLVFPRLISPDDAEDPVVSLGLGVQHSILLHASGRASSFGSDQKRQLHGIDTVTDVKAIACTWNGTYLAVGSEENWRVLATGSHAKGQLGCAMPSDPNSRGDISLAPVQFPFTASTHRLLAMTCGSEHVLCLFAVTSPNVDCDDGTEVWGWGWNEHGNLGIGSTCDVVLPQKIWPNNTGSDELSSQATAVGIWAGCGTSWIAISRSM
jgi:protein ATS1